MRQIDLLPKWWSKYQKEVFAAVANPDEGNIVVEALAGSGKTTTIIESLRGLNLEILLCAFNKRIADELDAKVSKAGIARCDVMTLHGLGYRALQARWKGCRPDKRVTRRVLERFVPAKHKDHLPGLVKLVEWCKSTLTTTVRGIIEAGKTLRETDAFDSPKMAAEAAGWVLESMRTACKQSPEISFDDMVFVPAVMGHQKH